MIRDMQKILSKWSRQHNGKRGTISIEEYEQILELSRTKEGELDIPTLVCNAHSIGFVQGYESGKRSKK